MIGPANLCGPLPEQHKDAYDNAIRVNVPSLSVFLDEPVQMTRLEAFWADERTVPLVRHEGDNTFTLVHGLDILAASALEAARTTMVIPVAVMYPDPVPKLPPMTPTQDLILQVLAARHRAGDDLFTFDSRTKGQAEALEQMGLIHVLSGVVPKTYRASLTWAGRFSTLMPGYQPGVPAYESFVRPPLDAELAIERMLTRMTGPRIPLNQTRFDPEAI